MEDGGENFDKEQVKKEGGSDAMSIKVKDQNGGEVSGSIKRPASFAAS